jgi:hypothetical protein
MDWKLTYEMAPEPPPAMQWEVYEKRAKRAWQKLLRSEAAKDENAIHAFLEQHPSFVPGAFSFPCSGHYPFPTAVISKPPLSALGIKIPDFLWIAVDSFTLYPVFVEIENPTKRWLTKNGSQHSDLSQAQTQLAQWKAWFSKPENQGVFLENFQIPRRMRELEFRPQYVLVHGSREEFDKQPHMRALAAKFRREDEHLMTFNRLEPVWKAQHCLCVKKTGSYYEAVSIPPTVELSPHVAMDWQHIRGKEEAAKASPWLTEERRKFLIRRFAYWDQWAKNCDGNFASSSKSFE